MVGLGTLVNSGAILAGAGAGLLLRRGLPEKWQESIMQGVALCIIVIGVQMAFKSENIMVVIFSIVLGAIVGEGIDIDTKLQRFGDWIGSKLIGGHDAGAAKAIGEGFVAASLIYCVGAMAIIGSLQDGLKGDTTILFAKSTLDYTDGQSWYRRRFVSSKRTVISGYFDFAGRGTGTGLNYQYFK